MGPEPPSATTRSACQPVAALAVAQALSWSGKSVSVDSTKASQAASSRRRRSRSASMRWASGWLIVREAPLGAGASSSHPPQGVDEAAPAARQALGCGSQHDAPRRRTLHPDRSEAALVLVEPVSGLARPRRLALAGQVHAAQLDGRRRPPAGRRGWPSSARRCIVPGSVRRARRPRRRSRRWRGCRPAGRGRGRPRAGRRARPRAGAPGRRRAGRASRAGSRCPSCSADAQDLGTLAHEDDELLEPLAGHVVLHPGAGALGGAHALARRLGEAREEGRPRPMPGRKSRRMTWMDGSRPSADARSRPRPWPPPRRGRPGAPGPGRGRGPPGVVPSRPGRRPARPPTAPSSSRWAGPRRTMASTPGSPGVRRSSRQRHVAVVEGQEAWLVAQAGTVGGPGRRLHDVAAR